MDWIQNILNFRLLVSLENTAQGFYPDVVGLIYLKKIVKFGLWKATERGRSTQSLKIK